MGPAPLPGAWAGCSLERCRGMCWVWGVGMDSPASPHSWFVSSECSLLLRIPGIILFASTLARIELGPVKLSRAAPHPPAFSTLVPAEVSKTKLSRLSFTPRNQKEILLLVLVGAARFNCWTLQKKSYLLLPGSTTYRRCFEAAAKCFTCHSNDDVLG